MYTLDEFSFKNTIIKIARNQVFRGVVLLFIVAISLGVGLGKISLRSAEDRARTIFEEIRQHASPATGVPEPAAYVSKFAYEQAIIDVVKAASPSVVSIIISKNVPVIEREFINPFGDDSPFGDFLIPQDVQRGTQKKDVGAGSGFIVSEDGLIITNKHVVVDADADYAVLTNDGKKYVAKVVALDPVQDVAIIKIQGIGKFTAIKLGDSNGIEIGQSVIAIGNALGEFRNTVSVGVISGLQRTVSASGSGGFSETLEDIIQTDAAINPGNSGGPLLNLNGEVIGIDTAVAQGAQSIGFAIPINIARRDIDQILKTNKITYPFLGVRYLLVDEELKEEYRLSVNYGAFVTKGEKGEAAITKDSPADKAGLKEQDVILTVNDEKVTPDNSMAKIIQKYAPGDKVILKVLRDGKEIVVDVILTERP